MAVNGRTVNQDGDILLITLTGAYSDVLSIVGYTDEVIGEDTLNYFIREFRWSTDNKTYSDWDFLTNINLNALIVDPDNPFWIEYRYTAEIVMPNVELEFVSITLEIITKQGTIIDAPCLEFSEDCDCSSSPSLIIDEGDCCGDNIFNPYDVSKAIKNYEDISSMISCMFGIDSTYYKTNPKVDSADVIFREHSLHHVVAMESLKINVPDNEFPSREIQFDAMGLNSIDMFEVHIVKKQFEAVFGTGTRPREGDAVSIPAVDRLYSVNSIALTEGLMNNSSFYKVMLTDWQDRASITYDEPEFRETLEDLTDNLEDKFGEETTDEIEKIRKPKQYNTIGTGDKDYVRKEIDPKLLINEFKLRNNFTVISKYHYDLSTITRGNTALIYRYVGGLAAEENKAFTFWVKPNYVVTSYSNVVITGTSSDTGGYATFTTASEHSYTVGDFVEITGSGDYDGYKRVTGVTSITFTISTIYGSAALLTARSKKHEVCNLITYGTVLEISYFDEAIIVSINGDDYIYDVTAAGITLEKGSWYGIVINLSNAFRQISAFVWNIDITTATSNFNVGSSLANIFSETITTPNPYTFDSGNTWEILGTSSNFTNFRIFKAPIEIEEQSLVLQQYVVTDSHLSLLIDNAIPGLRLVKKSNPR